MRVLHKICKRHHRSTKTRKTPGYLSIAGKIILVKKPHMKLVSSSDCSICVIQDLPGFSWTFVPLYNTCIRSYLTQDIAWKTIFKIHLKLISPFDGKYVLYKRFAWFSLNVCAICKSSLSYQIHLKLISPSDGSIDNTKASFAQFSAQLVQLAGWMMMVSILIINQIIMIIITVGFHNWDHDNTLMIILPTTCKSGTHDKYVTMLFILKCTLNAAKQMMLWRQRFANDVADKE